MLILIMPTSINSIASLEDSEHTDSISHTNDSFSKGSNPNPDTNTVKPLQDERDDKSPSLADQYEDYEYQDARNSGGGGSKKPKNIKHGRKTTQAIKQSNTESAERNRKEFAMQLLKKDLEHFPAGNTQTENSSAISNYLSWISKSLQSDEPINLDEEITSGRLELSTKRRSSGPGGQNVNKTAVTAVFKHTVSGLIVESTKTRELPKNQQHALSLINSRIQKHLNYWKVVLANSDAKIADIAYLLLQEKLQ